MRDAMQFHIEGLQESGDPVPEPGSWTTAVEVHVLTQAGENRTQEYTVVLEPDDDRWSAAVPDVQGCIASGTTRDEAIANVRHALQYHLQSLQEQAAPIPAPGTWTAVVEVEVPAGEAAEAPRQVEAR
jgi:predicted RNase H-like HicB family nuclease